MNFQSGFADVVVNVVNVEVVSAVANVVSISGGLGDVVDSKTVVDVSLSNNPEKVAFSSGLKISAVV